MGSGSGSQDDPWTLTERSRGREGRVVWVARGQLRGGLWERKEAREAGEATLFGENEEGRREGKRKRGRESKLNMLILCVAVWVCICALYIWIHWLLLLCNNDYVTAVCSQESDPTCLGMCALYVIPCEVLMVLAQYFEPWMTHLWYPVLFYPQSSYIIHCFTVQPHFLHSSAGRTRDCMHVQSHSVRKPVAYKPLSFSLESILKAVKTELLANFNHVTEG